MWFCSRLPLFAAALWWGGSGAIGFLAVPLLFTHLPTAAMAGSVAARLFAAQTWLALGCGLVLLLFLRQKSASAHNQRVPAAILFIVGGMLLAVFSEFAIAPRIVARENLKFWHGVGSVVYLLQWCCAGATLWWAGSLPLSTDDAHDQV